MVRIETFKHIVIIVTIAIYFEYFFSLLNVYQRKLLIKRYAVCVNKYMGECFKSHGVFLFLAFSD